jgi:hypothetical protein
MVSPSDEDVLGRFVVASFRQTFRLVPTTLYVSFNDVAYLHVLFTVKDIVIVI